MRTVLEIQQCLEDTLSKVIKHGLPQDGLLLAPLCNHLAMATGSLERILALHSSIIHLSLLTQAILLNQHLVAICPVGTSRLLHQLSRLPKVVVMITMVSNNLHINSKILVVPLLLLTVLVTIMARRQFQAIINKDKAMLKMAMVDIMHHLNLGTVSHQPMINSRVILQRAMVM